MAKTNAERVAEYREKLRANGVVEVLVRVPVGMRGRMVDLASRLRDGAVWPGDPPPIQVERVEVVKLQVERVEVPGPPIPGPLRVERIEVPGPTIEIPGPVRTNLVDVAMAALVALTVGLAAGAGTAAYKYKSHRPPPVEFQQ